jgi:phosphate starvation-inducible PhoH-like protein
MSKKTTRTVRTDRVIRSLSEIVETSEDNCPSFVVKPLVAMNDKQRSYIKDVNVLDMIMAKGRAGTSKTYIAICKAAEAYTAGTLTRLYLTRPNVSQSKSLGFFGGSKTEKVSNWVGEMLTTLEERIGREEVANGIETGVIVLKPLETIKGTSLRKGEWLLVDEAQDLTESEAFSIATRSGTGSKIILMGDIDQKDIHSCSGLDYLFNLAQKNDYLRERVGMINFDSYDDVVRGETCKQWLMAKDGVVS